MRRRGRWTRESGVGWRLDGTDAVLDFDPLASGTYAHRGCWCLYGSLAQYGGPEEIDHFLDGAMEYVENQADHSGRFWTPDA